MNEKTQKRPSWVSVIGILAIIFGLFGLMAGTQEIVMPQMLEMQTQMMENITRPQFEKSIEKHNAEIPSDKIEHPPEEFFKVMEDMLYFPDWYKSWAMVIGLVSIIVSTVYLVGGIFLLMMKKYAISLFGSILILSILWSTVRLGLYFQGEKGVLIFFIPGVVLSIIIDIVLIIVLAAAPKESFKQQAVI